MTNMKLDIDAITIIQFVFGENILCRVFERNILDTHNNNIVFWVTLTVGIISISGVEDL